MTWIVVAAMTGLGILAIDLAAMTRRRRSSTIQIPILYRRETTPR